MRELMLKLLTYEPFEAIVNDEKEYIDLVLARETQYPAKLVVYKELFEAFDDYVKNKSLGKLVSWKSKYYPKTLKGRVDYPVLFRKITFYCITESNMDDAEFTRTLEISIKNINSWKLPCRYRKIINNNTYSTVNIQRNGKKQSYLTEVIKAAYYEASRQVDEYKYVMNATNCWQSPAKSNLLPFIDVFSSTGTVAASVDAREKVVNDADIGVACYLFAVTHDLMPLRERLAQLHNNFVSVDMSSGKNLYSINDWQGHKANYPELVGIPEAEDLMVRLRNNYQFLHDDFQQKIEELRKKKIVVDFSDMSNFSDYYDIGALWLFQNSIGSNGFHGNQFHVTDMDVNNYCEYLFNILGVKKKGKAENWKYLCKFALGKTLDIDDIRIKSIKKHSKALSHEKVEVTCDDFRNVTNNNSDGFIYYDSPYFLTTDYEIPFRDEEHKQMLDILRDSEFKWLFSMQYRRFWYDAPEKDKRKRENNVEILIKNYREYYCGFVNEFITVEGKKGKKYYVTGDKINKPKADKLYVILFEPPKSPDEMKFIDEDGNYDEDLKDEYMEKNGYRVDTTEMMICNFDVRRVIPYGSHCVVIPFMKFIEFAFYEDGCERDYPYIRSKAREYRASEIQKNYHTGAWV